MRLNRLLSWVLFASCWSWTLLPAGAAGLNVSFETILGALERNTENDRERMVIPVYEYIGLDYGVSQDEAVSFHFYGWGRSDIADSAYYDDNPDGELIYGYVDYYKPHDPLQGRFGRQHIFAGVTNESVDGLQLGYGVADYFAVTIFGGLPAAYGETNGIGGDITYGGRLAGIFFPHLEIGFSYQKLEDNGAVAKDNGGVDLNLDAGGWLSLSGLSSYRMDRSGWREHRYKLNIKIEDFQINPSYDYFRYRDYFSQEDTSYNMFNFLADSDETLGIYGTDLLYSPSHELQVGLRGRQYNYRLRRENAKYMAGLVMLNTFGGSQIGAEFGSMDGETPDNLYNLFRCYAYWQNPLQIRVLEFISADALFVTYDEPVYNKESSTQFSLGAGRNFFDNFMQTRLSVIYSNDPYLEVDLSGVATLQINY